MVAAIVLLGAIERETILGHRGHDGRRSRQGEAIGRCLLKSCTRGTLSAIFPLIEPERRDGREIAGSGNKRAESFV